MSGFRGLGLFKGLSDYKHHIEGSGFRALSL